MSSSSSKELDMGELFRQRRAKTSNKVNAVFDSRRGGHHRSGGRAQQILAYPLEQGCVRNLKDNFGFILCAEREEEVFFHFSEVIEGAANLQNEQEVEFRIGPDPRSGRSAAFQIKTLPAGTVEWETIEYEGTRQTGLVERRPRSSNNNNNHNRGGNDTSSSSEGTIRLLKEKDDEGDGAESNVVTKDGPLVRFASKDYNVGGDGRRRNDLGRGDLVECLVVKEKRTGLRYAREIVRLLTERERTRQEEEKKMMASATLEKGVVVALKDGFGFLRSSSRREEIFFHYDSIDINEENPESVEEEQNFVLKEGQEMQFLVVDESAAKAAEPKTRTVQRRISARRVQLQPRGSVKFNEVVARGVTGVLVESPQCMDSSHALETHGKILLDKPVEAKKFSMGDPVEGMRTLTEVFLSPQDSPGGRFSFHNGSSVGLYVEPGDALLFDLAIDYCDGACRAVPTTFLTPHRGDDGKPKDQDDTNAPAVRLIDLSLAGRAEGFVGAVKDSYGFIQYVERPVDVHFRMFQLLPDHLQDVLRLNMGIQNHDEDGKRLRLEVGANVQFDLSLRGTIGIAKPRGRQKTTNERENLKAQRILLLPNNNVCRFLRVGVAAKGRVHKQELMQPFVGNVELEEPMHQMKLSQRHPFVYKLLSRMVEQEGKLPICYHDTQSSHEEDIVRKLATSLGGLEVTVEEKPPARIIKISPSEAVKEEEEKAEDTEEQEPKSPSTDEEKTKQQTEPKHGKLVKSVRFDKKSFSEEALNKMPLGIGDVIQCDIVQCRRTGQSLVENIQLLERHPESIEVLGVASKGIVKDVSSSCLFGFIVVSEDGSEYNKQVIYFRATEENGTLSKLTLKKGDNVKFDLGKELNGRIVALNVSKLAKGSVSNNSVKSECRGIVLLQPTHTSLKNTPSRKPTRSNSPVPNETNKRWGKVTLNDEPKNGGDEPIAELGCILITDDPDDVYANERKSDSETTPSKDCIRAKGLAGFTGDQKLFVRFKSSSTGGNPYSHGGKEVPKRGDLVSFSRGANGPIDVKTVQRGLAKPTRGNLVGITPSSDTAVGGTATLEVESQADKVGISLRDVVSCNVSVLKENEKVEGLLYDGSIYGIARLSDLYLESKRGVGHKERPKLNLTVKKDRGGTIMAQSKQAKGPDGNSLGFKTGWTVRLSQFAKPKVDTDLSLNANDFVPSTKAVT